MRQSLRAVAAVALVVLAGCGAAPAPGPSPPTTESPEYPPGVTEDGLDDWRDLLDAHRESVLERGAAVTSNTTVEAPIDGEVRTVELSSRARAGPDAGPIYYETERVRLSTDGELINVQVAVYADEEGVTERFVTEENTSVEREPADLLGSLRDQHVVREWRLQRALSTDGFTVATVERRDGQWVTTLVANEGGLADSEGQFSASVEVAETGRVLALTMARNPDTEGSVGRERVQVAWQNGTTVDPPEWVE